jgi:hypothetical protein
MYWAAVLLVTLYLLTLVKYLHKLGRFVLDRLHIGAVSKEGRRSHDEKWFYDLCHGLPLAQPGFKTEGSNLVCTGKSNGRIVSVAFTELSNVLKIETPVCRQFDLLLSPVSGRFSIQSSDLSNAQSFTTSANVASELSRLPENSEVRVEQSTLALSFAVKTEELTTREIEASLGTVTRLAHYYDIHSNQLKVWHSTPAARICSYCRGSLDGAVENVVECTKCGARLHRSCRQENGQCTTFGCSEPQRH